MESTIAGKNLMKAWLLVMGLTIGGLVAVLVTTTDMAALRNLQAQIMMEYLWLALILMMSVWLIDGFRIKLLLNVMGSKLGLWDVIKINFLSALISGLTPASSGGPPSQSYFLCKQGVPVEQSLAAISCKLLLTFVFFGSVTPLILLFYRTPLHLPPGLDKLLLGAAGVVLLVTAGSVYLICSPRTVGRIASLGAAVLPARLVKDRPGFALAAATKAKSFNAAWRQLFCYKKLSKTLLILVLTVVYWMLFFAIAPVLLAGLGFSPPVLETMLRQLVFYFLMSYVPLPGASGMAEVSLATIYAAFLPHNLLAGFVAAWRFLTYHLGLLVGSVVLLSWRRFAPR